MQKRKMWLVWHAVIKPKGEDDAKPGEQEKMDLIAPLPSQTVPQSNEAQQRAPSGWPEGLDRLPNEQSSKIAAPSGHSWTSRKPPH